MLLIITVFIWQINVMLCYVMLCYVSYLCSYFVRTTNTCTNIITLQYELDIYILGSNTAWRGWGNCSGTLPYSKFRHISWEQMITEHRGLSIIQIIMVY